MSEIDWDTPESAERYDHNCDHQFQKGQVLIETMKIIKGDYVLDLGCGTGRQAVNILEIIRAVRPAYGHRSLLTSYRTCTEKVWR